LTAYLHYDRLFSDVQKSHYYSNVNNDDNNNAISSVYGAVVMTTAIVRVHLVQVMNLISVQDVC